MNAKQQEARCDCARLDPCVLMNWTSGANAGSASAANKVLFTTAQRRKVAKPLDYYARQHRDRNEAIQSAYASGGHGLKAIGDHFGLHTRG
jgi:hypothetical protein